MPKGAPTLRGFERQVRRAFQTHVRRVRLKVCWKQSAGIEWDEGTERIGVLWVDPYARGIGWAVFHEMTHYVEKHRMKGEGEKEEPQVEGLATATWRCIEASPRRYYWWTKAIEARLVKGDL